MIALHGRNRSMRVLGALAVAVLIGVGCMGPGAGARPGTVQVAVSRAGAVTLDGESLMLAQLPRALRKRGATSETGIVVSIPEDTPRLMMKRVSETLATAGFARIMFAKPLEASARTAE